MKGSPIKTNIKANSIKITISINTAKMAIPKDANQPVWKNDLTRANQTMRAKIKPINGPRKPVNRSENMLITITPTNVSPRDLM